MLVGCLEGEQGQERDIWFGYNILFRNFQEETRFGKKGNI
jgi:hypothetical protein